MLYFLLGWPHVQTVKNSISRCVVSVAESGIYNVVTLWVIKYCSNRGAGYPERRPVMVQSNDTHLKSVGYILWLFGFGYLYDLWTLNEQVSLINRGT